MSFRKLLTSIACYNLTRTNRYYPGRLDTGGGRRTNKSNFRSMLSVSTTVASTCSRAALAVWPEVVRKDLPPESTWADVLANTDSAAETTRQRIRDMQQLQSLCDVKTFVADVSEREQVLSALQQVQSTFGTIDGLLHTAGILRDGAIATKTDADLRAVYAAKALSASACCDVVLQSFPELNFVVLFSSMITALPMRTWTLWRQP